MANEDEGGCKPALSSKTLHFNVWSGIFVQAIWPFLPATFRQHDYAVPAVTAWFTLGNIALRFVTREAISISLNLWRRFNAKTSDTSGAGSARPG